MKKRLLAVGIMMVLMVCVLTGCTESNSSKEKYYTSEMKQQIFDMHGLPQISNGYEYSQLKEIYELRDDPNLVCHWYTKNNYTGKWIYQGTCVGYGIPYGASITNPERYEYSGATLPLEEPNGLYTNSVTSSATWILTTDKDDNIKPTYVESEITVSQTKLDERLCEEWSIPENY